MLFREKEMLLRGNEMLLRGNEMLLQFGVSCGMFSDVSSLVLRDSDTDSENVSLIRRSVSDGQETCSSKGVSLIGI